LFVCVESYWEKQVQPENGMGAGSLQNSPQLRRLQLSLQVCGNGSLFTPSTDLVCL